MRQRWSPFQSFEGKKHNPVRPFCYNQQYSITALTDASGSIVERYAYTAYGQPTFASDSGTVLAASAEDNRYTYTGQEWDETLGLYHYRARMYDPAEGRFLGRDPIKYARMVLNLYAGYFAFKSAVDPGGNDWVWPWDPNAQWWSPFSGNDPPANNTPNPYQPPSGGGNSGGGGGGGMAAIYACAAGAIAGVTADQIERVMNGENVDLLDGQAIAAAVTGCFWAGCGAVVVATVAAAPTVIGACFIAAVGGVACLYTGKAICQGISSIAGADPPWFCDAIPWPTGGGGGGRPGGTANCLKTHISRGVKHGTSCRRCRCVIAESLCEWRPRRALDFEY